MEQSNFNTHDIPIKTKKYDSEIVAKILQETVVVIKIKWRIMKCNSRLSRLLREIQQTEGGQPGAHNFAGNGRRSRWPTRPLGGEKKSGYLKKMIQNIETLNEMCSPRLRVLKPTVSNPAHINQCSFFIQRSVNEMIMHVLWLFFTMKMAADEAKRKTLINRGIAYIQQHGFDGIDLSWRLPSSNGGSYQDRVSCDF